MVPSWESNPGSLDCMSDAVLIVPQHHLKIQTDSRIQCLNAEGSMASIDTDPRVKKQRTALERWEESLMLSTSLSQLWVHCSVLETSVAWSRSSLHAYCRICRRKSDGEHMLLCDACDRGHHMYCLKPPVKVGTYLSVALQILLL